MSHVRHTAPLITRKQAYRDDLFVENLAAAAQSDGDLAALRFIETRQVACVQFRPSVRQGQHVSRRQAIDLPSLGAQE
ncbi:hypothetical protein D3C77_273580 [compost metagenome]